MSCTEFGKKEKLNNSLWVALVTFVCFLVIGSPFLYRFTSYFGQITAKRAPNGTFGVVPSWIGWIVHSIVAGGSAIGFSYLLMKPHEKTKFLCDQPVATNT